MTGKGLNATQRKAILLDLERAVTGAADPIPWQTDTCIGDWHYRRSNFDRHTYKTPAQVIQMLIDIVSKNGNLMLNIRHPGNGMPDDDELTLLDALARWIEPIGEAIYGTRPWALYGEGPSTSATARHMVRPENGKTTKKSPATGSANFPRKVAKVELFASGAVKFTQDDSGLVVTLPQQKPGDYAYALKITPT
jgi:alpha-L-fucosidase